MAGRKKGRPPKRLCNEEAATILAYAKRHGAAKAAMQYGVSKRTIQRYRTRLKSGTDQDLADLVAQKEAEVARRNSDELSDTFHAVLREVRLRLKSMSHAEVTSALATVGELQVAILVLNDGEDERAPIDWEGPAAPAGARREPSPEESAAIH